MTSFRKAVAPSPASMIRLMAKFSGQWGRWGPLDFWSILNFLWQFLEVGRGLIGFIAPLSFKWLDSQPDSSNMGPVPTDFHYLCDFQRSWCGMGSICLLCFCLVDHLTGRGATVDGNN